MSLFFLITGPKPLVLSVTDSTPTGSASGPSPTGSVTSNSTTVSVVSGGSGTYTYAWTISGSPATDGPFNCAAASSASTTWSQTCSDGAADPDENWQCLVTDTGNGKTATALVTVTLTWFDTT